MNTELWELVVVCALESVRGNARGPSGPQEHGPVSQTCMPASGLWHLSAQILSLLTSQGPVGPFEIHLEGCKVPLHPKDLEEKVPHWSLSGHFKVVQSVCYSFA